MKRDSIKNTFFVATILCVVCSLLVATAAVVLREGAEADPQEIRAFASERLASFKVPKTVLILDEIPKGPTGKPRRIGLAEQLGLV